jgi:hypothetical protein
VGPNRKSFKIHKKLPLTKSKFCKTYCYKSAGPTLNYHQKEDSDVFTVIFEWLYRQKIPPFPDSGGLPANKGTPTFTRHSNAIAKLLKVYCLAKKKEIPELIDLVMNQLGKTYHENVRWPSQDEIYAAYTHAYSECGLWKFMSRSYTYMLLNFKGADNDLGGGISNCRQFLTLASRHRALEKDTFELMRGLMSGVQAKALVLPVVDMVCDYHEHGKDEACEFKGMNFRGKSISTILQI